MGKIVKFDSSNKEWKEQYGDRFCFVDDFIIDDEGDVFGLAKALDITEEELRENSAFKITPKRVVVRKGIPVNLITMKGEYNLPLVSVNGIKFELLAFADDKWPTRVEILD